MSKVGMAALWYAIGILLGGLWVCHLKRDAVEESYAAGYLDGEFALSKTLDDLPCGEPLKHENKLKPLLDVPIKSALEEFK